MTIADYVAQYIEEISSPDYLSARQKPYSLDSIRTYAAMLRGYARFMDGANIGAFNAHSIKRHFEQMAKEGKRARSVKQAYVSLSLFAGWLIERETIAENPLAKLKPPRLDPPKVYWASDNDCEQLAAAAECVPGDRKRALYRVTLYLLMYGGLRNMELANLEVKDVDLHSKRVRVREGKGGKTRWQNLNQAACDALAEWLELRGFAQKPYLLMEGALRRVGEGGIRRILSELKAMAQISNDALTPHSLRRWYGTALLRAGADPKTIQDCMGHSSLATTYDYLQSSATRQAAAVESITLGNKTPQPVRAGQGAKDIERRRIGIRPRTR